jgi:uncharacterized protein (TIGR02598 family)
MVEIVIALAVISVGVIGILGLLPNALDSSRNAADNTLAATIVQDTFSTIRTQPFAAVDLSTLGPTFPPGPYNLQFPPLSITAYFDGSGLTPATAQDNYYKVVLNILPQGTLPLSLVTATVTWPDKSAAVHPPNTNVFVTQVANYQ